MCRSLAVAAVLIAGGLGASNASAQRYDDGQYRPNGSYDDGQYRPDPRYDDGQYRPGGNNGNGAVYDYARVVRVDPVIVNGARGSNQRCYERNDGGYINGNNGYQTGSYGNNGYGSNNYGNNSYRNDGYDDRGQDNGQYRQGSETGRQLATVIGGLAGAVLGSRIGGGDGRYLGTAVGTIAGGAAGRAIYEANNRPTYQRGDVRVCEPSGYGSESERVDGYDVTYEYAGRQFRTHRDYHPGEQIRVRVDVSAD